MRFGWKIAAAMAALFLAVVAVIAADDPADAKAPPVPGRIMVAGDSLTWDALFYGGGFPAGWDTYGKVYGGAQAETFHHRIAQDVDRASTSPETFVMAFGSNDAGDGFSQEDRNQVFALAFRPHDDTCTVMVKPHNSTSNATRQNGLEQYRAYVDQLVAAAPDRITSVDWRPTATQPGIMGPDGVHHTRPVGAPLTFSDDGATFYPAWVGEGVAAYRDFLVNVAATATCEP